MPIKPVAGAGADDMEDGVAALVEAVRRAVPSVEIGVGDDVGDAIVGVLTVGGQMDIGRVVYDATWATTEEFFVPCIVYKSWASLGSVRVRHGYDVVDPDLTTWPAASHLWLQFVVTLPRGEPHKCSQVLTSYPLLCFLLTMTRSSENLLMNVIN